MHICLSQNVQLKIEPWPQCYLSYSKPCVKRPPSKIGFLDQLSLNEGRKYCRMLTLGHSAIFLAFIKLLFVIKISVSAIFEWPVYTGFTVRQKIFHGV